MPQPAVWQLQDHDALLFDCDGTLADTMPAHYRAWLHVTEAHGIAFDEDRFYSMGGRPTRDIVATLARERGIEIDVDHAARMKEASFLAQLDRIEAIDPVIHGADVRGDAKDVAAQLFDLARPVLRWSDHGARGRLQERREQLRGVRQENWNSEEFGVSRWTLMGRVRWL
jgi:beta-phosphoglucomutase-like phosphatase (HAD superfamily)